MEKINFDKISFEVKMEIELQLYGKNGIGKSSILKLILGKQIQYNGVSLKEKFNKIKPK